MATVEQLTEELNQLKAELQGETNQERRMEILTRIRTLNVLILDGLRAEREEIERQNTNMLQALIILQARQQQEEE
jgi:DNA replication protein DnaC